MKDKDTMDLCFTIMNQDVPLLKVRCGLFKAESVWVGPDSLKIPRAMEPEHITPKAVERFCESRQPPRTRYNINEILKTMYGLTEYLPIQMCRMSHGVSMTDHIWLRFEGEEELKYADVRCRK